MSIKRRAMSVIGLGKMGPHHVRVALSLSDLFDVVGVYDLNQDACLRVSESFDVPVCESVEEAIDRAEVVYVATPTSTHYDIARQVIAAGRDVFVEKPLADTVERAETLVSAARQTGVCLRVGHTERFNPTILWLAKAIKDETVLSINIERIGPRPPRINDVGIVTDLSVHDLDLISYLSDSPLNHVRCMGTATTGPHEDVAQIVVSTQSGVIGSISTNWLTPFKSRRIMVATPTRFYRCDLLRSHAEVFSGIVGNTARYGVEEAAIRWEEPLRAQAREFSLALQGEPSGNVDGDQALCVLRWAHSCLEDLSNHQ